MTTPIELDEDLQCSFMIDPGILGSHGYMDPPEYCDGDRVDGTNYCQNHVGADEDDTDYEPSYDYTAGEYLERHYNYPAGLGF